MTKKHFIALASLFSEIADKSQRLATVQGFITIAREDNPHFDSARFLKACGL